MIVATAGHVDHGKTSLVRALTGVDTDRLEEEQRRGLTIDLGFAYVDWNDHRWGFIDVPGHQRFVGNMLAGVAAIDLALVVIAADEGPMPQTREHLEILDLLEVNHAVVAMSRCDLADAHTLAASEAAVRHLLQGTRLEGAPCIAVSAVTGHGIEQLRDTLNATAPQPAPPRGDGFRLAVDRAFSIAGAGLVVTGSAHAGHVQAEDTLRLLPGGQELRVRSIRSLDRPADSGGGGERLALNLTGAHRDQIRRGQWLVSPEIARPVLRFDARLRVLPDTPLRSGQEVHVHHGASHAMGRITLLDGPADAPRVHVAVREPLGVLHGDRFVLRDPSARHTLCGGRVLDPAPPTRSRKSPGRLRELDALEQGTTEAIVDALLDARPLGLDVMTLAWKLNRDPASLCPESAAVRIDRQGGLTLRSSAAWDALQTEICKQLGDFHLTNPQLAGMGEDQVHRALNPRPDPPQLRAALRDAIRAGHLARTATRFRLPGHRPRLDPADATLWERVRPHLARSPRQPPVVHHLAQELELTPEAVAALLDRVQHTGAVLGVAANRFLLPDAVAELAALTSDLAASSADGSFSARSYRDAAGIGRNLTIDLLEFFDRAGLTRRYGDQRRLLAAPADIFGADRSET